jgi:hypothetical protein
LVVILVIVLMLVGARARACARACGDAVALMGMPMMLHHAIHTWTVDKNALQQRTILVLF